MGTDLRPALVGSLALHLALAAATLIVWPSDPTPIRSAPVPVTIVTRAPMADLRPAVEAPDTAPAESPEPAPVPDQPAPAPEPTPAPPTPAPTPPPPAPPPPPTKAARTPPPPTPPPPSTKAPRTPAPPPPKAQPKAAPAATLDLDALAKALPKARPQPRAAPLDLNALAAPAQRRVANARRGAERPETSTEARPATGAAQGLTADEASLLAAKLIRLWRPNCGVEGSADVQVRVNIRLTPSGQLSGPPAVVGGRPGDPIWAAAAQRALSAVAQGEPYSELPRARYEGWKEINFNFNGRQACQGM